MIAADYVESEDLYGDHNYEPLDADDFSRGLTWIASAH